MSKKLKLLTSILIIIGILFVYVYYSPDKSGEEDIMPVSRQAGTEENTPLAGMEILKMLAGLESIEMNASFFENDVLRSLVDFSVELSPEESGRPNPFAPLD